MKRSSAGCGGGPRLQLLRLQPCDIAKSPAGLLPLQSHPSAEYEASCSMPAVNKQCSEGEKHSAEFGLTLLRFSFTWKLGP